MSIWVENMQADLRQATTRKDFVAACAHYFDTGYHVKIDSKAVDAYARSLRVPSFIPGWDDYLSKRNKSLWSRTDDFIELAVSTSINAGYLYKDAEGKTAKWEVNGSGAQALVGKMNDVRAMQALPALHLKTPEAVNARLSDIFNTVPHGAERLLIWAELAQPKVREGLRDILYSTRSNPRSKQHHFGFDHIRALADLCPHGFGDDPFLKKAMLLPMLFAGDWRSKRLVQRGL